MAPSGTSSSSCTKTAPRCSRSRDHVAVVDDLAADVHRACRSGRAPAPRSRWPARRRRRTTGARPAGPSWARRRRPTPPGRARPPAASRRARHPPRMMAGDSSSRARGVGDGPHHRDRLLPGHAQQGGGLHVDGERPGGGQAERAPRIPFTRERVDTIGPTVTVEPRRRRAAATSGADAEAEPAPRGRARRGPGRRRPGRPAPARRPGRPPRPPRPRPRRTGRRVTAAGGGGGPAQPGAGRARPGRRAAPTVTARASTRSGASTRQDRASGHGRRLPGSRPRT